MVSVERIKQFSNIPSEAEWLIEDCLPTPNWPNKGDIEIIDLKVTLLVFSFSLFCIITVFETVSDYGSL